MLSPDALPPVLGAHRHGGVRGLDLYRQRAHLIFEKKPLDRYNVFITFKPFIRIFLYLQYTYKYVLDKKIKYEVKKTKCI